jgi:hypothetical protein
VGDCRELRVRTHQHVWTAGKFVKLEAASVKIFCKDPFNRAEEVHQVLQPTSSSITREVTAA